LQEAVCSLMCTLRCRNQELTNQA